MPDNSTVDNLRKNVDDAQNIPQNSINNYIENVLPKEISSKRAEILSNFKDDDGKTILENNLTQEQKNELEEKLKPEIEQLYKEGRDFVHEKTTDRLNKLNECKKEIDELKESLTKEITDLEAQLATLDPKSKEYEDLNKEINEKQGQLDRVEGLIGKYKAGFSTQQAVLDQGLLGLQKNFNQYPYINVEKDKSAQEMLGDRQLGSALKEEVKKDEERLSEIDKMKEELSKLDPNSKEYKELEEKIAKKEGQINNINNRLKRNKDLLNYAPEEIKREEPEQVQEQEQQEQQVNNAQPKVGAIPPDLAAKLAQQMGGGRVPVENPTLEEDNAMTKEPNYLEALGYDSEKAMDYDYACLVLSNFAEDGKFSDYARVDMLNNPEVKRLLENSLKVAGSNLNPLKSRKFNATRDKILGLANGQMKIMALQAMGKDIDFDNIKKQFNDLNKEYNDQRKQLEEKLNGEITDDKKLEIENQLNDLDERYKQVKNVSDFSKSTNNIKTLRTRFISFKDALFKKESYKQLKEGVNSFMFEDKDDTAKKSWENQTYSENERNKNAIKREEREQGQEEIKIEKDDLNRD